MGYNKIPETPALKVTVINVETPSVPLVTLPAAPTTSEAVVEESEEEIIDDSLFFPFE
jgi:hypothetical protein